MSHLSLDARAILGYLNELGYRNISSEQLREFMKDLRKLIKYDEKLGIEANKNAYFESLFMRTTASYRNKVDKENGNKKIKDNRQEKRTVSNRLLNEQNVLKSGKYRVNFENTGRYNEKNLMEDQPQPLSADQLIKQLTIDQRCKPTVNSNTIQRPRSSNNILTTSSGSNTSGEYKGLQQKTETDNFVIWSHSKEQVAKGSIKRKPLQGNKLKPRWEAPGDATIRTTKRYEGSSSPDHNHLNIRKTFPYEGKETERKLKSPPKTFTRSERYEDPISKMRQTVIAGHSNKQDTNRESLRASSDQPETVVSGGTLIPRSKSRIRKPLSTDPVALYHYYQQEWKHFRKQIPGESSHSDLRWNIRHKLLDPQ